MSNYFSDDSSFFFVGDFGKTFVAYGRQQIEEQIDQLFWAQTGTNVRPIGYNINIEQKMRSVCVKLGQTYNDSEVAIVIIGTIKAIHSSDHIRLTKLVGRRFVQTFLLFRNSDNNHCCKSTVLAFLAPSDAFNLMINQEVLIKPTDSLFDEQIINEAAEKDLNFVKIPQNIDEVINQTIVNDSKNYLDSRTKPKANELLPISLNELFSDNITNKSEHSDKVEIKDPFDNETFSYLNDIWSQIWNFDNMSQSQQKNDQNKWFENSNNIVSKGRRPVRNQSSGTSFADALRNGSQHSLDEKSPEIKIIENCSKSRFKQNHWQNDGKSDKRSEFDGRQNITLVGAQNLEEIPETNILFVANIPYGISKTDFIALFDIYGKVLSVKFVERTGIAFAFVYFERYIIDRIASFLKLLFLVKI